MLRSVLTRQKRTDLHRLFTRRFTVLGLESSADDTCAAVVTSSKKILSNVVLRHFSLHEEHGGIQPLIALHAHQKHMALAIAQALNEARMKATDLDGIAFTRGPGMGGCLNTCLASGKAIASALEKPMVGVHHMQAHALTPFLTSPDSEAPRFPFLTLLVSGGHTLLLLAKSTSAFQILATTHDQSIGRSLDKISRMLELRWDNLGPGAALEKFAQEADYSSDEYRTLVESFVLPMQRPKQFAFSFSGIHSQIERHVSSLGGIEKIDRPGRALLAAAAQTQAFAHLEDKLKTGLQWCKDNSYGGIRHLVISGGVASNEFLRAQLRAVLDEFDSPEPVGLVFPPASLCTDNAAMIAWASMHRFLSGDHDAMDIDVRTRWSIEDLLQP